MKGMHRTIVALLLLPLAACGVSDSSDEDRHIAEDSRTLLHPKGKFDEVSARADAVADVSDQAFDDVGDSSTCTDDCSGHEAGFEWAKENDPEDPESCGGGESDSFDEGCTAFHEAVDERVSQMKQAYEDGEDES